MRISDWSSDVCSSDLAKGDGGDHHHILAGDEGGLIGAAFLGWQARVVNPYLAANGGEVRCDFFCRGAGLGIDDAGTGRSEEHTSELQSLMRSSYAVFCLKKKQTKPNNYIYFNTTRSA